MRKGFTIRVVAVAVAGLSLMLLTLLLAGRMRSPTLPVSHLPEQLLADERECDYLRTTVWPSLTLTPWPTRLPTRTAEELDYWIRNHEATIGQFCRDVDATLTATYRP